MDVNYNSPSVDDLGFPECPKLNEASEASVLWDEYKYRHDLIWHHLIRSTLALIALVTVRYTALKSTVVLVTIAWLVALVYWVITLIIVEPELRLFKKIKSLHRKRQTHYFSLHKNTTQIKSNLMWGEIFFTDGFSSRVGFYLLLLLIATLLAGPMTSFQFLFCRVS